MVTVNYDTVTVELLDAPWYEGRRRFQLFTDYMPCLRAAGLMPILMPTDAPLDGTRAEAAALLDRVDGLLMTGGDDADLRPLGGPAPVRECKPVPPEQQALNLALVEVACERRLPLFGGLDKARFRRQVVPGDELLLEVELGRMSARAGKGSGRATVNGELATSGELMFVFADA